MTSYPGNLREAYRARLASLIDQSQALVSDEELLAQWARYLSVLLSGYLEVSLNEICTTHVQRRSDPTVQNFVESDLRNSLRNPNVEKIKRVMFRFDPEYGERFVSELQESVREDINSIVNTKNRIAHGDDTGVTMGTIRKWFESCQMAVAAAESIMGS